jgi:hypothetical protein
VSDRLRSFSAEDPLFDAAAAFVVEIGSGSCSKLQRRFNIGFTRAAGLLGMMARAGIVGGEYAGTASRVAISLAEFEAMKAESDPPAAVPLSLVTLVDEARHAIDRVFACSPVPPAATADALASISAFAKDRSLHALRRRPSEVENVVRRLRSLKCDGEPVPLTVRDVEALNVAADMLELDARDHRRADRLARLARLAVEREEIYGTPVDTPEGWSAAESMARDAASEIEG